MIRASDIVGEAQSTDAFLEEMRRLHKRRLRTAIRSLENKMIDQLAHLDVTKSGKLEGIKVNLKQSQKIHAKMLRLFEEEYGQAVSSVIGDYPQIANHIKRSWRSLGEAVHYTDIDRAMLASLQEQSYDQFAVFGEAAQSRMATAMYDSVVAGTSYAQLVKTIQGILRGHTDVRGRPMSAYANTHAFDAVMNFHNQVNMKKADDLGIKKFMYVGDVITTTRPFCRRRAGNLYTRAQIERWNGLSWSGKSGPPLTNRGGYNCRHHWRGFKDDWLDEAEEAEVLVKKGKKVKKKAKPKAPPMGKPKGKAGSSGEVLSSGEVTGSGTPEKGGVNTTEIKTLEYAGREVRGAFKPISGEAFRDDTWEPYLYLKKCPQAYREVMASEIDTALGLNIVPVTILRKLDGEYGSLQEWIENSTVAVKIKAAQVKTTVKEMYRATVFDVISGNVDRHSGNWLVNPKTGKVTLIDNGLAFITGKTKPRSQMPAWFRGVFSDFNEGDLMKGINAAYTKGEMASLVKSLKALDVDTICERLTPSELAALKKRINIVINAIEGKTVGNLTFSKSLDVTKQM